MTLVVYRSKYGATKQYATWIAEELHADLLEMNNRVDFEKYDTIIFGGGLYAESIAGLKTVLRKFRNNNTKRLVVFSVGLFDPSNEKQVQAVKKRNIPSDLQEKLTFFHLQGSMEFEKLTPAHALIIRTFEKYIDRKKDSLSTEEKKMFSEMGRNVNFVKRDNIDCIIDFVNEQ